MLGAGADVSYGVPTVANLMRELAAFVKDQGAPIDKALRKRLPYLRFTFDRYAAGQGDALIGQLFAEADDMVPTLLAAADKLKTDETMAPIGEVIAQLCSMASSNRLSGANLQALARFAGEASQVGGAEPIIEPSKISLSQTPAAALRSAFQQALVRGPTFTPEERQLFEFFIVSTSNIEELLSHYFTLYSLGRPSDQRTFLYLAWMLWSFLQFKSVSRGPREGSIYARLPSLGGDVITFNYTNFFVGSMARRVKFFHGRLDRYLRIDDRTTVSDDRELRGASTPDKIVAFLNRLRLDVADVPHIDIPALVPPISFKPVMSREQLRTWAEADDLLQLASHVVVVGYSFATADEHFNDLLRKSSTSRMLIVNPDLDTVLPAACRVMGVEFNSLAKREYKDFDALASTRITGVRAKAEDVDNDLLAAVWR